MNIRIKYIIVMLIGTICCLPVIYAEGLTGLIEENGNMYYYDNNTKLSGFQEINGKRYFFSRDTTKYGVMRTGMLNIDGNYYYLNPNATVGLFEYNENKYYANGNGEIQGGFQEIEGKTYFFSRDKTKYGVMKTGMLGVGDNYYYLNPNLTTGWFEYQGNRYYANEKGEIQGGFQEIEGKTYFFSRDKTKYGVMKTGMLGVGDNYYYLNPNLTTGSFEYNKNKYYANEKGEIQGGFQEIEGKTYFFSRDKTKYGVMKTGMLGVGDNYYYLNPNLTTGSFEYNKNKYYANEKGEIQGGFQEIEGKTYFLSRDKTKYGVMKTGMLGVGDNYYYLNPNLTTGSFEYNKNKYYANEKGEIQGGFQEIEGKTYFFSRDKTKYGVMKTGMLGVGDNYYFLNPNLITSWFENNGNKYYANENGEIQLGFQEIDGKKYFFSRDKTKYGAMCYNWITVNDIIYYLNLDGVVVTGKQNIEGRDYLFDENGALQGFKTIDGKLYYYNPDGSQAKGIQRIAGRYYKFNEFTGAFEKYVNQKIVIDISSHNGTIDWEAVKNSGKVDGVILRLGYSVGFMDTQFLNNVRELNRLGIPYSVYLFSYAENGHEAGLEANFLINTIKNNAINIASNLFSIYYDLEDWEIKSTGENSYGISKDSYRDMILTFTSAVEQNLGIKARVYASKNYIETRFPTDVQGYATWVAQWGPEITYKGAYEGWQYTSNGSIPGIKGRVDMSIFYY